MSNIKIRTSTIGATDTEPQRIRVTLSTGETGVYPYPHQLELDGVDAHEHCAAQLIGKATFDRIESFYKTGETATGYHFTIFLKD